MQPDVSSRLRHALESVPPAPLAAIRARAARLPRKRSRPMLVLMSAMVAAVTFLSLASPGNGARSVTIAFHPTPVPGPTMT